MSVIISVTCGSSPCWHGCGTSHQLEGLVIMSEVCVCVCVGWGGGEVSGDRLDMRALACAIVSLT